MCNQVNATHDQALAVHVIVPDTVRFTPSDIFGDIGHNRFYFCDGHTTAGIPFTPLYADIFPQHRSEEQPCTTG